MKRIRVALTALLVGGFMFATSSPAFAEQAFAEVTCAKGDGAEKTFAIGWDNSNSFFEGKGDIPRLYCEGGYSQPYNFYVRDNLPADSPLRWYNGIAPVLEPTPEPVENVEPEPVPSVVESLNPEPTEPTQTESPEPTPEVTETTEPVIEPTVEPEPAPTPKVSQIAPMPVVEPTPTPSESVQEVVQVEPVAPDLAPNLVPVNDQVVTLSVPSALAGVPGIVALFQAAEAFMNIGSDMTPEEREESQSVVVAAVIVGQLAIRKNK
jgi:outer membrane biosynthesis protein TonB